jgi:hypothetical protein
MRAKGVMSPPADPRVLLAFINEMTDAFDAWWKRHHRG